MEITHCLKKQGPQEAKIRAAIQAIVTGYFKQLMLSSTTVMTRYMEGQCILFNGWILFQALFSF